MWVRPSINQGLPEGQFHNWYMRIPKNIFHFSNQFLCLKMDFFPTLSYCENMMKPVG